MLGAMHSLHSPNLNTPVKCPQCQFDMRSPRLRTARAAVEGDVDWPVVLVTCPHCSTALGALNDPQLIARLTSEAIRSGAGRRMIADAEFEPDVALLAE